MRTLTVTGHGEARVAPDAAVVRVSVVHLAPVVADALAGADRAAEAAVTVARRHTAPERVASTGLSIWRDGKEDGVPGDFRARHSLTVACPSIDAAGALLTELADVVGDALQVEGVSLEVSDPAAAAHEAREAAYADAVERATHLAALAGAALGDPQEIVEGGPVAGPVRFARAAAPVSFQPGETGVGASVTVTVQLR